MNRVEDWLGKIATGICIALFAAAFIVPAYLSATSPPVRYVITVTRPDGTIAARREVECKMRPQVSSEWGGQTAIYSEGIIAPVGWMLTVTPASESP